MPRGLTSYTSERGGIVKIPLVLNVSATDAALFAKVDVKTPAAIAEMVCTQGNLPLTDDGIVGHDLLTEPYTEVLEGIVEDPVGTLETLKLASLKAKMAAMQAEEEALKKRIQARKGRKEKGESK